MINSEDFNVIAKLQALGEKEGAIEAMIECNNELQNLFLLVDTMPNSNTKELIQKHLELLQRKMNIFAQFTPAKEEIDIAAIK